METSVWLIAPVIAIVSLVLHQIYKLIYNVFFHPLSHFPGRLVHRASYLPSSWELLKLDTARAAWYNHQKYGPVVRQNPGTLTFSSAEAWKDIYHHKPGVEREFPKDVDAYVQGTGMVANVLFAQVPDHARLRRALAPGFTEKALIAQEEHLQSLTDRYLHGLRQRSGVNSFPTITGEVDISAWNHFIAYDTVTSLAFGESTECLETAKFNPWCDYCQSALIHSTWLGALPTLPLAVQNWILPQKHVQGYFEHMRLSELAAKRRVAEGVGEYRDWVSHMLRAEDHKALTKAELIDNINVLMPAAAQSTGGSLDTALWYLLHHIEWYHKLVKHIRSEFENEKEITIQRTGKLELVQAIINEGMRLHPPVPVALPRVVPQGGRMVAGVFVPEKTVVGVHQLACYRSPDNFREPDSYHPERWLGDKAYESDRRDIFYPFSTGPRICLGERFAAAQLRLVITRLLWNFDLELLPDNADIEMQNEVGIWNGTAIRIKVSDARRRA